MSNTEQPQQGWPPAGGESYGTGSAGQAGQGAGGYGYYGVPQGGAAAPAPQDAHGYGYYGGVQSAAAGTAPTEGAPVAPAAVGNGYYGVAAGSAMPGATRGGLGASHAGAAGAPATAAPGAWTRGDRLLVILVGLVGGVVAALLLVLTNLFLFPFSTSSAWGLFLAQAPAGSILVTHALFVGMLTRRPGATITTAAVSLLPAMVIGFGVQLVESGSVVILSNLSVFVPFILFFYLCGLVLVAGIAEAIQSISRANGGGLLVDTLTGLALPLGWLLYLLLQYALPFYSHPSTKGYSLAEWGIWLGLSTVWALLFSGLIPAAIARGVRRGRDRRAGVAQQQAAGIPSWQGGSYGQAAPGQQPWGVVLPDHPSGTTALVLGILGVVGATVLAPFAWGIASRAKAEIRQQPGRYREGGSVQAGYVLGIVGTVLLVIGVLAMIGLVVFYVALARGLR